MKKSTGLEVRKLENQIASIDSKIGILQNDVVVKITELKILRSRRQAYQDRLNQINNVELTVSDHALIRYMERVLGYDVESLRQEIQRSANPLFSQLKVDCQIPTRNEHGKFKVIIKHNNIVSVIPGIGSKHEKK